MCVCVCVCVCWGAKTGFPCGIQPSHSRFCILSLCFLKASVLKSSCKSDKSVPQRTHAWARLRVKSCHPVSQHIQAVSLLMEIATPRFVPLSFGGLCSFKSLKETSRLEGRTPAHLRS